MPFDNPDEDPRDRQRRFNAAMGTPSPGDPVGAYNAAIAASNPAPTGPNDAPGAHRGSGYVNLAQYLAPNMAAGQGMADHVAGETARQGDAEMAALQALGAGQFVPGDLAMRAQDTAARARLAGPGGGGLGTVLAQDYGQTGPYSSGMSAFDAFLTAGAGGKTLQASANKYGGLGGQVDAYNKAAAVYTPPAAAAPSASPPSGAPTSGGYTGRPRAPGPRGPSSPLTYAPEGGEGRPARLGGQQIDPNSGAWWKMRKAGGM